METGKTVGEEEVALRGCELLCKNFKHIGNVVQLKLYKGAKIVEKRLKPVVPAMLICQLSNFMSSASAILSAQH